MKTYYDISSYFKNRSMKRRLSQSNNEYTIMPFLHGLSIKYRKFASYVFVPDQQDIKEILKARNFKVLPETDLQDYILDLGTGVMYNDEYNWMFVLVDPKKWTLINTAIEIAEQSTGNFEAQCLIVLNSVEVLGESVITFNEIA